MKLVSSAFADGSIIPRRFTCDGENISPPLQWSGAPAGTQSLVLLCNDPDAPSGTWHHWAAYDIPPRAAELAIGPAAHDTTIKQAVNDFRKVGYGGPCPPHGHGLHHYHFRLLALTTEHLLAWQFVLPRQRAGSTQVHDREGDSRWRISEIAGSGFTPISRVPENSTTMSQGWLMRIKSSRVGATLLCVTGVRDMIGSDAARR